MCNSKGTIDNNALHDLQMTAELSSHIKLKAKSSGEEAEDVETNPTDPAAAASAGK